MEVTRSYQDFLASKRKAHHPSGFEPMAFTKLNRPYTWWPYQKHIVSWALRLGRAAIFADCGLTKTLMQMEWARQVAHITGKPVMIEAPLLVAKQTVNEGLKFGIPVTLCRSAADVRPGVNVSNYEMLHAFDCSVFGGVVLDESSILKSFTGSIKRELMAQFANTPYKLTCTATPSPNDHMELGNHSEFLGVLDSSEMLSRWFLNDTMKAGGYRLKNHARESFWQWVASWAVCIDRPSDIGFSDDGFVLPPLNLQEVVVPVDQTKAAEQGRLFRQVDLSATSVHREMRLTAPDRAAALAKIVNASPQAEPWIIWCNTDYEADELTQEVIGAVEISGSMPLKQREEAMESFLDGRCNRLITKPSIAGFGMNFQHCANMAFVGLSYSFEQFYQATRRCWRYGQKRPVNAYVVIAETEGPILETIRAKQARHLEMRAAMTAAMKQEQLGSNGVDVYAPIQKVEVPSWLTRQ